MQPTNPQRPVMDISTPRRPVPAPAKAPSLPVREAPQSDATEEPPTEHEQRPAPAGSQDDQSVPTGASQTDATPDAPTVPTGPPTPPREEAPMPVGAIVATVFAMVTLSAAAILVYLKT